MGLFTLIACSEDVYQDADKMNEAGAVENTGSQNSVKTVDTTIPYESPYGTSGEAGFEYLFINNTPYEWKFTPFLQLCFYDGANDGSHFGHNLSFNYFDLSMTPTDEYTTLITANRIVVPPHTTEVITMNNGKILPVDPMGPTTASGQFFDLEMSNKGPLTQTEMDFFGDYLKFVALEGSVYLPSGGGYNTTIRFPLGPQYGTSPIPNPAIWGSVPMSGGSTDIYAYNINTKEVCVTNGSGWVGARPSLVNVTIGSQTYTASAYTTRNQVVVVLE